MKITHFTRRSIQARLMRTIAQLHVAIGTGIAGRAATSIRALTGIEASAAVSARLMIRTIIQILITKQSAPAFVAQAFPRFLACTVQASRIPFAFAAQTSFPADMASEKRQKIYTVSSPFVVLVRDSQSYTQSSSFIHVPVKASKKCARKKKKKNTTRKYRKYLLADQINER